MNKRKVRATARAVALKEILEWHGEFMRHRKGRDCTAVAQGMKFYQVGQNASHDFFVGVDADGRKFVRTVGEGSCDENGDPTVVEQVYAVEVFSGHYFGHY